MRNITSVVASILLLSAASNAAASLYIVTSPDDSGSGTLRAAVASANASPGVDEIAIADSLALNTIRLTSGPLTITDSLSINGPSAGIAIEQGTAQSRVFEIKGADASSLIDVSLTSLKISNGQAPSQNAGGAIYSEFANLKVAYCYIGHNHAQRGGGIATRFAGSVSLNYVSLVENGADYAGGGIDTVVPLVLENSYLYGNTAAVRGGGLYVAVSQAAISNTVFQENAALGSLPGAFGGSGGAIALNPDQTVSATLKISRSLFYKNRAMTNFGTGALAAGGAIWAGSAARVPAVSTQVENSTFYMNFASVQASGQQALGGAMYIGSDEVVVSSTTVYQNYVVGDGVYGGGMYVAGTTSNPATLDVVSTLVFDNQIRRASGNVVRDEIQRDPSGDLGNVFINRLNYEHSLAGVDISGVINGSNNQNLMGVDPLLQDPDYYLIASRPEIFVLPIAPESPARDKGSNPTNAATDQRGGQYVRAWEAPDMGAYEDQPAPSDRIFRGDFEA